MVLQSIIRFVLLSMILGVARSQKDGDINNVNKNIEIRAGDGNMISSIRFEQSISEKLWNLNQRSDDIKNFDDSPPQSMGGYPSVQLSESNDGSTKELSPLRQRRWHNDGRPQPMPPSCTCQHAVWAPSPGMPPSYYPTNEFQTKGPRPMDMPCPCQQPLREPNPNPPQGYNSPIAIQPMAPPLDMLYPCPCQRPAQEAGLNPPHVYYFPNAYQPKGSHLQDMPPNLPTPCFCQERVQEPLPNLPQVYNSASAYELMESRPIFQDRPKLLYNPIDGMPSTYHKDSIPNIFFTKQDWPFSFLLHESANTKRS